MTASNPTDMPLKPCPFCGRDAERITKSGWSGGLKYARCTDPSGNCAGFNGAHPNEWNTRADLVPQVAPTLEELVEQITEKPDDAWKSVEVADTRETWINPHDKTQKQWLPWIKEKVIIQFTNGEVHEGWHTGGSWMVYAKIGKHFSNDKVSCWAYPKNLAALVQRPQDGWKPIETAPKNDFIIVTDGGYLAQVFWQSDKWVYGVSSDDVDIYITFRNPTHWMPLPAAPTKHKENE